MTSLLWSSTCVLLIGCAQAKISQNRLYSNDMILESREAYDIRPFIGGFGDTPGEQVTVSFVGTDYPTTVGADGHWEVQMNCCDALRNKTLVVAGEKNTITYTNVACGQVFVCSGQSNMELPLSYVNNGTAEIAAANRPDWRLFRVPHVTADTPQDDMPAVDPMTKLPATWLVSNSTIAAQFSATCYLTARHIDEMLWGENVPIGLIWSAWGGTRVEAWAPASVKDSCKDVVPGPPAIPGPQQYSALYNGMIAPLTRYSIRAAFWFQGEHNVVTHSSQALYACEFGGMINAWRDAWKGIGDFPFFWVQLAAYTGYSSGPGHGDTSVIRLAQADDLPHIGLDTTGMAVAIDLGDPKAPAGDVHSREKEQVAYRLALQAMHVAYAYQEGENVTNYDHPTDTPTPFQLHFSGPMLRATDGGASAAPASLGAGGEVTLKFTYGEGLYLNDTLGCDIHRGEGFDGKVIGGECCKAKDTFQLCTGDVANSTWLNCANATIKTLGADGTVVLTADMDAPTLVRYAYSNYPQCALYNKHGLPAGPFLKPLASDTAAAAAAAATSAAAAASSKAALAPPAVKAAPAQTPPMGVNTWNAFHCNVDERKMRAMADALVTTGLAKAGYEYVNIDDCWQVERSPNGTINADPARFPGGMKSLADYIHTKGLKFGVYTAQREFTCQRRPGSWEHEAIDVASYCEWGVDYLKLDACTGRGYTAHNESWIKFRAAIDQCSQTRGFPMVLSVESCDDDSCGQWIGKLANLWRTCGDIQAYFGSVMNNVAENTKMAKYAGPTGGPLGGGHWNDADMLQVGDIGLSITEQRSHYALWSLMASPLLIGSDVSMLTPTSLTILGNVEATAVNQDRLGIQGIPVGPGSADFRSAPCWSKPLANGDLAVILLNTGANATKITCSLADLGWQAGSAANVRDIWLKKDVGPTTAGGLLSAQLDSHDHSFLRLSKP